MTTRLTDSIGPQGHISKTRNHHIENKESGKYPGERNATELQLKVDAEPSRMEKGTDEQEEAQKALEEHPEGASSV